MRFDAITLFPAMFDAITRFGITSRAYERGLWSLACWNPRDFAGDAYRSVDDRPYGGGPGMVMLAQPLAAAIDAARDAGPAGRPVVALSPQGRPLDDARVRALARSPGAILVAGRYEAIDQRLVDRRVDEEIAIGEFVVSGGELPAMMLIDAVVRLLPGAMNERSPAHESFADGLLDHPQYTRPEVFEGQPVPAVLMSGHHARIERWRRQQAVLATQRKRPDLIERARARGRLDADDERILAGAPLAPSDGTR